MPSTRFVIKMDPSGECDVHLDNKRLKFDLEDVEEALHWIKRNGGEPREQVTVVEPDGYRVKRRLR